MAFIELPARKLGHEEQLFLDREEAELENLYRQIYGCPEGHLPGDNPILYACRDLIAQIEFSVGGDPIEHKIALFLENIRYKFTKLPANVRLTSDPFPEVRIYER